MAKPTLTDALILMAESVAALADAQVTLIENTTAIKKELQSQTPTIARAMKDQRRRADEMMTAARKLSDNPQP